MSRSGEQSAAPVPRATPADQERVGTVIDGRYRLDALVGKGGMGLVYRAEHVGIRRTVALKLLHSALAQMPELRSRFEREARAIGVISHPNCVDVTDFGELADGSLYLAMEYVDGQSLGEILDRERALEPVRALRVLRHVLAGLGHAHHKGIVHRDIKPENVLLTTVDGDPDFAKILDFGIAKLLSKTVDDGVKLTQAGVAFGTPVYMSPEQALGNPVDRRADLYAASVMAYEALCGRPPFYSDDKLEVLSMHTTRPVPGMDEARRATLGDGAAALPAEIEPLIARGLAKQPLERWQSAEEYSAALYQVLAALGVAPPRPTTGARPLVGEEPLITPTELSALAGRRGPVYTPPSMPALPSVTQSEPILLVPKPTAAPAAAPPAARPTLVARLRARPYAVVGGALLVVAIGALAIVLATRDDARPEPRSAAAREAAAKLDRGDPAAAIRLLEAKKDEIAGDAEAQLQLGRAHAARREQAPALLAFRRALELDPALEHDGALRASLWAITREDDMTAAMAAYELLITLTKDGDARGTLLGDAVGDDPERRRAADALVERLGLGGEVDWLAAYLLDLEQGDTCARRREAVAKLRALGDARAIPALQASIDRKGRTGKWKGKPVNGCLADDARAAAAYLAELTGGHVDAGAGP